MRNPRTKSDLQAGFLRLWLSLYPDGPRPQREHGFHPTRKWRFDFAWPARKLAVEIEGGICMRKGRMQGHHVHPKQYTADCRKYNAAQKLGWRVLRYTTLDVQERPVQVIEEIMEMLK